MILITTSMSYIGFFSDRFLPSLPFIVNINNFFSLGTFGHAWMKTALNHKVGSLFIPFLIILLCLTTWLDNCTSASREKWISYESKATHMDCNVCHWGSSHMFYCFDLWCYRLNGIKRFLNFYDSPLFKNVQAWVPHSFFLITRSV